MRAAADEPAHSPIRWEAQATRMWFVMDAMFYT
jgi:hypothetical protein